jgi:hypothetical protein
MQNERTDQENNKQIDDLMPIMLSDVIAKECEKKIFMAYLRGLSHSYQQDLTVDNAFSMGLQELRSWIGNLPTVGLVKVSEIMRAVEKYNSMPTSEAKNILAESAKIYNQNHKSNENKVIIQKQLSKKINNINSDIIPATETVIKQKQLQKKINKKILNVRPTEKDIVSSKSFFYFCIASLKGSYGKVISLRYKDDRVYTLENVGDTLGVTRERVRQIEKQALKTISDYLYVELSAVYEKSKEEIEKKIFGERLLIQSKSFLSDFKKLNIFDIFLITAKFGGAKEWAKAELQKENKSYIKDKASTKNAADYSEKINRFMPSYKLPVPVEIIAKICNLSPQNVRVGLLVEEKFSIYDNYVIEKKVVTARVRRAINAHLLLTKFTRLNELQGIELPDFATLYRNNFNYDKCSSRDLDIVFVQNPHLFFKLYEYGWIAINPEITIQQVLLKSRNELNIDLDYAKSTEFKLDTLIVEFNNETLGNEKESQNQQRKNIQDLIKLGKSQGFLERKDLDVIDKRLANSVGMDTIIDIFKKVGITIKGENLALKDNSFQPAINTNDTKEITILSSLQKILSNGAMRFEDIRKKLVTGSNNAYSPASTGPVLINNQDTFTRYAPSIYGLRDSENDLDYLRNARNLLLVIDQCELYCLSAMAGVGVGSYILWDYQMEYLWATWLTKTNQLTLVSSLLFVANPCEWPCEDWEKRKWIDRKSKLSFFGLKEKNRFTIQETEVSIYQVVAAATVSIIEGFTSWALINRAIGARLDDRHSQSLLGLLIYLGISEKGSSWQEVHSLADGAKIKVLELLDGYSKYIFNGDSNSLYQTIENHVIDSNNLGWMNKIEIYDLHSKLLRSIKHENLYKDNLTETIIEYKISINDQMKSALLENKIKTIWKI